MNLILNILWFIFGGCILALGWALLGCLWCISIIGIPVGLQCFKFAQLTLAPFGKEVVYSNDTTNIILNVVWIILGGLSMALGHALVGLVWCITVVGIPVGLQNFKMAKLALAPLGARVLKKSTTMHMHVQDSSGSTVDRVETVYYR